MGYEDFIQKLHEDGEYECTCFINPPCTFCTETANELYKEWCEENKVTPSY